MTTIDRVVAFIEIMSEKIDAVEVKKLAEKLFTAGFFDAPASTKYHGAYAGGLFDHSLNVTKALLQLTHRMGLKWDRPASPYIVGMLHDLCKCDQYKAVDGGWEYVKDLPLNGHGDKSVIVAQMMGVNLTDEEMLCIRWHMGAFDDKENWNHYTSSMKVTENVLWAHTADMMASQILEV